MINFDDLFLAADRLSAPISVAAAGAADRTVLEALATAHQRGWVAPILLGKESAIHDCARECGIDIAPFRIVDSSEPGAAAVAEVRAGRAQLLMKGQIPTPELMKAVLNAETGLRTPRVLCQIVLMQVRHAAGPRCFLLADTGICIQPTLEQKADILRHTAAVARSLGVASPRLAMMAATEKVTEAMPDTLDAAELERRGRAGEFGECLVQGPLSFDLAYANDAGEKKQIEGSVVGAADGMIFPNLLAANLTVKAIMYTADCRFGGVICGAACPIVFMSRADATATRLNSLAFAVRCLQDLRDD